MNSVPDTLRRKAFLLKLVAPDRAVQQMMESVRVAEVVSREHHNLACERARLLVTQLHDPATRKALQEFIDQSCPPD